MLTTMDYVYIDEVNLGLNPCCPCQNMYVGVSSVPTILIRRLSGAGNLRELVADSHARL